MAQVPYRYERVTKADRYQAYDAANNEVDAIGRSNMDSRADTCYTSKKWRLLSTTGKLCYVKGFNNSYEPITNAPVGRDAT